MLEEVEYSINVVVRLTELDENKQVSQNLIVTRLLKQMMNVKSTEEIGYFLAVTELKRIGTGTVLDSLDYVLFPVSVQCRTFLPVNGEIMHGVVYKVNVIGVFMRRGPMRFIFLPAQKMPGYSYVHDDQNPCFVSTDGSRIGLDVVVSFRVYGTRWVHRNRYAEREYTLIASLEGNCLGPMALSGHDCLDLESCRFPDS
ncbi:DNA-directed RNA polymerase II subunit [Heracleum sosnowskyi]|uniref:DNA-directed RNA polymerase subunit n=1 Tax=Heracleum sosnowskyi TaxID=360622 RepID=A0AAD8HA38_9APIA|nr:DNA-directed RNA polymerase II subunit [Heracleum sosnowskyi]